MATLIFGFVGLVIMPALVLAVLAKRFIKEPFEAAAVLDDNRRFSG